MREAGRPALAADAMEAGRVGLHAPIENPAEAPRARLAARLARDVPARDVDGADGADHGAFLSVVARVVIQAVPEHPGLERIGADRERRGRMPARGGGGFPRLQGPAEGPAPPPPAPPGAR